MDRSVSKGIGTIIIAVVTGVVPQVLVVKEMITQTNANYWLIGSGILLLLGIYLVIRGTLLKSKSASLISSTGNQSDIAKDAAKVQLDHAKALSDDYFRSRHINRILRFIIVGVGLGLLIWGATDFSQHGFLILIGFVVVIFGFIFTQ